jgi:hypothetical protein
MRNMDDISTFMDAKLWQVLATILHLDEWPLCGSHAIIVLSQEGIVANENTFYPYVKLFNKMPFIMHGCVREVPAIGSYTKVALLWATPSSNSPWTILAIVLIW